MIRPAILTRHDSYAVVLKPAGVLSESGTPAKPGMTDLLARELNVPAASVYPVHRLDREVGGIMVYALNAETAAFFSRAVSEQRFQKTYLAVVPGVPDPPDGVWTDLLYHDSGRNKTYVVDRMRKGVRKAELDYRTLETAHPDGKTFSLLEIHLHTGRTHQIRVQCASRGLPLPGDRRYGGMPSAWICLYSFRLAFPSPSGKGTVTRTAPPPDSGLWSEFETLKQLSGG